MRGEYSWGSAGVITKAELPPRARRIRPAGFDALPDRGTTSACAENTADYAAATAESGNYLRVRGEYRAFMCHLEPSQELPPRARRIPTAPAAPERPAGTTSACAENTPIAFQVKPRLGNYLRVRGEYS